MSKWRRQRPARPTGPRRRSGNDAARHPGRIAVAERQRKNESEPMKELTAGDDAMIGGDIGAASVDVGAASVDVGPTVRIGSTLVLR
jgi:hypothetical protein